jgi:hypothetical protein
MKIGITVLAVAALLTLAISSSLSGSAEGRVAVPDEEAATLFGGGFDALVGSKTCSGTDQDCETKTDYKETKEAGTRLAQSAYCGVKACDSVVTDSGPCSGGD